jgi:hypothetical protein
MSDEYSYRDPKLSLWQAAAEEVQRKHSPTTGISLQAAAQAESKPLADLMRPVHLVAHKMLRLGKPLEAVAGVVEKGILDIKAVFDPVEDCANAAANFLQAEIEGDQQQSDLYAGQLQKSECDALGWAECLTTYLGYKALLKKPKYRPNKDVVKTLKPNAKVAIIGDWGTGADVAINILKQVAALKPDVLLHLGDVYFAGTEHEAKANFLDITRSILGDDIPVYSLCGNHDMYSGGGGYYWLLDQIGQEASYFCLQNDDWTFLAMDTGFHDNNPFNVATNMTELVTVDGWSEADWHRDKIAQAGDRKIVLLSHHQLFSPFGSVGTVGNVKFAYNQNLLGIFGPVLSKIEWWFWGHEHTLGVFPPYMGLKRGRCVGASAVPVFEDQQSYTAASDLRTVDDLPMPTWNAVAVLGTTDGSYNNCFAMMTLSGTSATVEYYEVPLLQAARRFDVVDTV